jgi:hypothetical protein
MCCCSGVTFFHAYRVRAKNIMDISPPISFGLWRGLRGSLSFSLTGMSKSLRRSGSFSLIGVEWVIEAICEKGRLVFLARKRMESKDCGRKVD